MESAAHSPDLATLGHERRSYVGGFAALAALTLLEVGVVQLPDPKRPAVIIALVGLALSKAALLSFFFMHLKTETRVLRLTALAPLLAPAIYAAVLMADSAWRFLR